MKEKIFVILAYIENSPVYEVIEFSTKSMHGNIVPCAILLDVLSGEFTYDNITVLKKVDYKQETNFTRRQAEEE